MIDFSQIRRSFSNKEAQLKKDLFCDHPIDECTKWLQEVINKQILDGNAMTLSTASKDGNVSARTVLLKYLDQRGFVFFTNYNSRKSKDLIENPKAALTFYWPSLNKQICAIGLVEKLPSDESNKYFNSRPRLNQLLASASNQDQEIESINDILNEVEKIDQKYKDQPLPRPDHWGGFLFRPTHVEFWQGAQGRVNLRFAYLLNEGKWSLKQLSP